MLNINKFINKWLTEWIHIQIFQSTGFLLFLLGTRFLLILTMHRLTNDGWLSMICRCLSNHIYWGELLVVYFKMFFEAESFISSWRACFPGLEKGYLSCEINGRQVYATFNQCYTLLIIPYSIVHYILVSNPTLWHIINIH